MYMTKKKNEITIRSSAAEYLTYIKNFLIVQKEGNREVMYQILMNFY